MLLATFVTADKSSSRRGAKLSPSETNNALTPLRGDTSSAPFGGTCLPAGRSVRGSDTPPACHSTPRTPQGEGLRVRHSHRGPIEGKALGSAPLEWKAWEIKRSARGRFFWLCLSLFGGAGQAGQGQERQGGVEGYAGVGGLGRTLGVVGLGIGGGVVVVIPAGGGRGPHGIQRQRHF